MSSRAFAQRVQGVLEKKAKVPVAQGVAVLKGKGSDGRVSKTRLRGLPDEATVIAVERLGSLSGVAQSYQKSCDYLVLYQEDDGDAAVFVELKETARDQSKGLEQLYRSAPFLEFLRSICALEWEEEMLVGCEWVLLSKRVDSRLAKQRVSDPHGLPSEEHKGISVRRLLGDEIAFRRLRGERS